MARLERFELPTARFVAEYSIQLSYRRIISKARFYGYLHQYASVNYQVVVPASVNPGAFAGFRYVGPPLTRE